ncbi:hydroxymethylpyrimidine/phosphomethylpyrimidine kinase [Nanchangia anserum]|uniref:pyridoxal kinase n=1 Tax=Nanchangia anserum TaxID=2692125 RepID=A0A8I0G867_9ACTO|nr:hydroxymethylpyrimidine/phosphomethylpyrimidine kinase [Nanchangia anserum]MBD3689642.1 hydroxymethylpyrimidine/phosphomethylpyrimidine kinase [Nanchangia anserum]QOX81824.1 hydroxymethylpyrimidine/phosphomethylpyrimidine kinase [Nanchangia anserum]
MTTVAKALVIAGSESTGGAGIQVDLRVFQQLGVLGVGALTCIVAFDPTNDWAHRFHPIEASLIDEQLEAAFADWDDLAVAKVGMLGTPATIDTVAARLSERRLRHVVVDPVLICKGQEPGAALDTDNALREKILPLATVVTPNVFEAQVLSGMDEITTVEQLGEAAKRIGDLGVPYVLAKGGVELPGEDAVDILWDGHELIETRREKVGPVRVSGAGCSVAAAITAQLAKGHDVLDAVNVARDLVTEGIKARIAGNTPFDIAWQGAYHPWG